MYCKVCGDAVTEVVCTHCTMWASGHRVVAEIVKNRAKNEYTPGATNYKLQYWARVKSRRNNRILMTSEVYVRRRSAIRCLELLGFKEWEDVYDEE
jgi:hypothetical protein